MSKMHDLNADLMPILAASDTETQTLWKLNWWAEVQCGAYKATMKDTWAQRRDETRQAMWLLCSAENLSIRQYEAQLKNELAKHDKTELQERLAFRENLAKQLCPMLEGWKNNMQGMMGALTLSLALDASLMPEEDRAPRAPATPQSHSQAQPSSTVSVREANMSMPMLIHAVSEVASEAPVQAGAEQEQEQERSGKSADIIETENDAQLALCLPQTQVQRETQGGDSQRETQAGSVSFFDAMDRFRDVVSRCEAAEGSQAHNSGMTQLSQHTGGTDAAQMSQHTGGTKVAGPPPKRLRTSSAVGAPGDHPGDTGIDKTAEGVELAPVIIDLMDDEAEIDTGNGQPRRVAPKVERVDARPTAMRSAIPTYEQGVFV